MADVLPHEYMTRGIAETSGKDLLDNRQECSPTC